MVRVYVMVVQFHLHIHHLEIGKYVFEKLKKNMISLKIFQKLESFPQIGDFSSLNRILGLIF